MPSLQDVYCKFGQCAEAAQLLETHLCTVLHENGFAENDLSQAHHREEAIASRWERCGMLPSMRARAWRVSFGGPMKYHLLTAAVLSAALALYVVGMSGGGSLLLLLSAALELWFWIRALHGRRAIPVIPLAKP